MKRLRRVAAPVFFLINSLLFAGENVIEFNNQPIRDIAAAISQLSGRNIVIDDTVTGSTSYFASENSSEDILDNFLKSHNLYITKKESVELISRIRIVTNPGFSYSVKCTENRYRDSSDKTQSGDIQTNNL